MEILEQIEKDYNQAFKEKNELAVLTLRQLKTVLTNASIAKNREPLAEAEVIKILRTEVKKRKESAELYRQGGRPEAAEKEKQEIGIVSRYLPVDLDENTIKQKIAEVIAKTGAATPADMGKVIGAVVKELGSQADGSVVSRLVKEALSKLS
ncbi:MAG: GatB/YqeY domain-containing protein [Patescibacteria group bacterium]|jgi:hypothetical protein